MPRACEPERDMNGSFLRRLRSPGKAPLQRFEPLKTAEFAISNDWLKAKLPIPIGGTALTFKTGGTPGAIVQARRLMAITRRAERAVGRARRVRRRGLAPLTIASLRRLAWLAPMGERRDSGSTVRSGRRGSGARRTPARSYRNVRLFAPSRPPRYRPPPGSPRPSKSRPAESW